MLGGNLKRYAARKVGLDQPCHHVHAGALGGKNHVNASGAGQLCKAHDAGFHLAGGCHHEICQFVNNYNEIGQWFKVGKIRRQIIFAGRQLLVKASHVAHAKARHGLIAAIHFVHSPIKGVLGLGHLCDHRVHKMRFVGVHGHFDALGVNEQQLHVLGLGAVQQTDENAVEAHAFARARSTRHKQMRHAGEVGHNGLARYVLAQNHGQGAATLAEGFAGCQFPEIDGFAVIVGYFNTHGIRTGNGRLNTHGHGLERQRQIIAEVGNAAHADARCRAHLVHGYHGARGDVHKLTLNVKIAQAGNKGLASGLAVFLIGIAHHFNRRSQQIQPRQGCGGLAASHASKQPRKSALLFGGLGGCGGCGRRGWGRRCGNTRRIGTTLNSGCGLRLVILRFCLVLALLGRGIRRAQLWRNGHTVKILGHSKRIVRIGLMRSVAFCLSLARAGFFFFKHIGQRICRGPNIAQAVTPARPKFHGRQTQIAQRPAVPALGFFGLPFVNRGRRGRFAPACGKPRLRPMQHACGHIEP